jgi:hypothetical protein
MAIISNVNRKATVKTLLRSFEQVKAVAGLTIQTHRAYESASRDGEGLTQMEVCRVAGSGVTQPTISALENGKTIPSNVQLRAILKAAGFKMTPKSSSGNSLLKVLKAIRDNESGLKDLIDDKPA